jgi:excisionase family DNA binding protein
MEQPVEKSWLSYREAALFTGLGRTSLSKLVNRREIRAARVGRAVRIELKSLREYMESNTFDKTR